MTDRVKELQREYHREYREKNRERVNANARRWRKENPEAAKAIQDRYWENKAKEELKGEVKEG